MPEVNPAHEVLLAHFDRVDPVIAGLARAVGPCRIGDTPDRSCFQALASAIASQQISGIVARRLLEKLAAAHDGNFPTPAQINLASTEELRAVGFSYSKVAALKDLAARTLDGTVPDDATAEALEDEALIARLVEVRGIGRWSAQMLLMFQLRRPDVMPADDFGVRKGFQLAYGLKGLPKVKPLLAYATRWAPYRSAACWYLWRALELHKEGRLPARAGRAPRIAQVPPEKKAKAKAAAETVRKARTKAAAKGKRARKARAAPAGGRSRRQ